MIESLSLEGLTSAELTLRARSIAAQLRRGAPAHRIPGMLARVQEIQAMLPPDARRGLRVDPGARVRESRPHAAELDASRPLRAPGRLEEQPLEALDVAALLRLRRALATTTPGARVEAIARRMHEIDRLLGATPRDYGILRASVRQVQDWAIELGMASLDAPERRRTRRLLIAAWRKGVTVTDRIMALTRHEPARAHALEAYRALDRVAIERIQACVHPSPHIPREALREELNAWRQVHQDRELPWPIEPTDEELDAAERAREASRGSVEGASTEVRWNYCPAVIPQD